MKDSNVSTKGARKRTKYIFVTGGVVSGLGKGITAASLGRILEARGLKVTMQKCDPYLNTDAGTLNPAEHGEVFVTQDGAETDLDLGHYERFIDRELSRSSSVISGQIYSQVIANERSGVYLGKTVQIIPHVTSEIQRRILEGSSGFDVCIVEIGGTVGDYEAMAFIEAIRQLKRKLGEKNVLYAHLVFVPYLEASKEIKTKPAQNSVRDLREAGIVPDVLFVRSDHPFGAEALEKMSLHCDVEKDAIVSLQTAQTVYEVPLRMQDSGIGDYICKHLHLPRKKAQLNDWKHLVDKIRSVEKVVNIGVIAKYMNHEDTYMSVFEALKAAGWAHNVKVAIRWVNAEKESYIEKELQEVDGVLVPGGFGVRGMEGKIAAAKFARENAVPYLGICLGMQVSVIEYARNVLGLKNADSTEMNPNTPHPVIHIMPDQIGVSMGGTMRLGNYDATLDKKSRAYICYGNTKITERHRHRYEFNNAYRQELTAAGLHLSGLSPDKKLVEVVELQNHPFYVASQFHPEFKSRPNKAHPLFAGFIGAIVHLNSSQAANIAQSSLRRA